MTIFFSFLLLLLLLADCTADNLKVIPASKTLTHTPIRALADAAEITADDSSSSPRDLPQRRICPADYFSVAKTLRLGQCSALSRHSVFMIWTTDPSSFSPRNQWAVESLFKHNPCVSLTIYSNTLPLDFFDSYKGFGLSIKVATYSLTDGSFGLQDGVPGQKWVQNIETWKKNSPYFAVHSSDFLRLVVLYDQGGTYMDMDHINISPLFEGETSVVGNNALGSEVCAGDNVDCLFLGKLNSLNVLDPNRVNNPMYSSRDGFNSFHTNNQDEKVATRFSPCNGVMINWEKHHPYIKAALVRNDDHYDPLCWGCMGPRMMGKLLLDKLDEQKATNSTSSYDIQVLAPGLLYPFDYRHMSEVMSTRSAFFESLIHRSKPFGVHFYGKVSTDLVLVANSTMGKLVRENSLFGSLPWSEMVKKPDTMACLSAPQAVANIRRKSHLWVTQRKKILNRMALFPAKLPEFLRMAEKTGTALVCHKSWAGIRQMTLRISVALSIPVILVDGRTMLKRYMNQLKSFLDVVGIRRLHVQGIPPNTIPFASFLQSLKPPLAVKNTFVYEWIVSVSYHSGIAVQNTAPEESILLGDAMTAVVDENILLTFLEHDQAAYSTGLGVPACAVLPMFIDPPAFLKRQSLKPSPQPNTLRVGLLGTGTRLTVKNYFTQIGAACMFQDAEVHVNTLLPYGMTAIDGKRWHINRCRSSIVEHGMLPSHVFQKELTTMDVNMYVSWTDAVPNVVLDSLAAGVPVITSDVTGIFDYSPMLKALLVESRIDDPNAIYQRTVKVLAFIKDNRKEFEAAVETLFITLREKTFASWGCFLNSTQVDMKCSDKAGKCLNMKDR